MNPVMICGSMNENIHSMNHYSLSFMISRRKLFKSNCAYRTRKNYGNMVVPMVSAPIVKESADDKDSVIRFNTKPLF